MSCTTASTNSILMASLVEIVGLVHIGITSVCSLVHVIKAGVVSLRLLTPLLCEAEELSENVRESLSGLTELAGIPNLEVSFFSHTLKKIEKVEQELHVLNNDVLNRRSISRVFNAEALSIRLSKINGSLQELLRDFTVVGMLAEVVTRLVTTSEERMLNALNRVLSSQADRNSAMHLIAHIRRSDDISLQIFRNNDPVSNLLASEQKGLLCYSIGKTLYDRASTRSQDFDRAARYMLAAYRHASKEAAFYIGRMYYDGKGMQKCYQSAFRYFLVGANNNDADSLAWVADCYFYGHGTKLNIQKCHEYNRLASDAGSPIGMRSRGYNLLYGTDGNQNWSQAKQLLERARLGGDYRANCDLAKCYQHGIIVERNESYALELLKEAYEKKTPLAMTYLARCYEEGIGTPQDLTKAAGLYRDIANKSGFEGKQRRALYGYCLVRGRGVKQNVPLGMQLIRDGLIDHNATGWLVLGKCYQNGYGLIRDVAKAIMCFVRGANATNSTREIMECNIALARMYETGNGLQKDMTKSVQHYSFAATRINVEAQWKMGLFYELGKHDIERDIHRAFDFFHKAARGGHIMATRKAGVYFMKGIGIPRDRSKGKRLLKEAIERGDDTASRILRNERIWRLFSFHFVGLRRTNST